MKSPWKMLFSRDVRDIPDVDEGQRARENAERELARVRSETPYYAGLGNDLRRWRERNHFAEHIRATIKGAES